MSSVSWGGSSSAPWVFAVACSFLLYGYEHIRSPSNAMLVSAYGVEALPVVMALLPLFAVPTLLLYNFLIMKTGPKKTLLYTSLGSALALGVTALAIKQGSRSACAILYWLRECYVLLLLEQVWSFVNSVWDKKKAAQSNGYILAVSNFGSMVGAYVVSESALTWRGEELLLVGAGMCVVFGVIGHVGYRLCPEDALRKGEQQPRALASTKVQSHYLTGLNIFRSHRSLVWILLLVVTSQMYSTFATLQFQSLLSDNFPSSEQQIQYSGRFFAVLCAASVLIQVFFSRLLLCKFDGSKIHLAIPFLHFACSVWAFSSGSLLSSACCLFAFKSLDYSLFRAAKEILYIPFDFNVRFQAKEWIDVLGYRGGKVAASLVVLLLQWLAWTSGTVLLAVFCSLFWGYSVLSLFWPSADGSAKRLLWMKKRPEAS